MANVDDAEFGDADTTRSGATLATLAIGDFGDDISLGDTSIATLEDLPSLPDSQALQHQKEIIDGLTKENAELRRHVKRRTQALDTIRRAYILDVDRLKRGLQDQQVEGKSAAAEPEDLDEATLERIPSLDFRPVLKLFAPTGGKLQISPCGECGGTMEIIHYDENKLVKLGRQIDTLREALVESGEKLGYSDALAETYRLKTETSSSEFSELNNMLLREMKVLKEKLGDAGPEVVARMSGEREKVESRLRSANRTVLELESAVAELQGKLRQSEEDSIKVAEMEYHLLEVSKDRKAMAVERDTHASTVDELRATVVSLNEHLRKAADKHAKLQKAFQDHEENNHHSIEELRRLLDSSKTNEAALRGELAELREENLQLYLSDGNDSGDESTDEPLKQQTGFLAASDGEPEVVEAPPEKSDGLLVLELTEGLRRKEEELEYLRAKLEKEKETRSRAIDKELVERELEAVKERAGAARATVESTVALGEDILSGAYARREEKTALEKAELQALVHKAEAQAHKCEQENRKLLKMWNLSRRRLLEVERANFSGEGGTFSHNTADPRKDKKGDEAEKCATSGRSRKRARRSTRKGAPLIQADKEQGGDAPSVSPAQPMAAPTSLSDKVVGTLLTSSVPRAASEKDDAETASSSDDGDAHDVMAVAMSYLEEDCRWLRIEKEELQGHCTNLKNQTQDFGERLERTQISFDKEKEGKEEAERELEERRELLSKATLAVAEHTMALHDAVEGTEKVKAELESEKQNTANFRQKIKEMGALNSGLEEGLAATKNALELMTVANSQAEAMAERNASQAERSALRAESNAWWAEAEGMRAEEAVSRHFLFNVAVAEKIATLGLELEKRDCELKRRRQEAKEHAEQMKEFRQVVAEKVKLKDEANLHIQTNLNLQQRIAMDEVIIEELKLQVVLLDEMRKEVLRLEGIVDRLQKELVDTKASLKALKKQHEAVEQQLREKLSLNRKLWAALAGAIFLVDDWCAGPLLAWRETDTSATPTILPKPPFEARAVEEIMKLRRAGPGVADAHTTYSTTASASLSEDAAGVAVSIEDRLEGQQPNKIKAWLGFRVQVVAAMQHNNLIDSARSEKLLLDTICKQRAAQTLNLEEALRRLEATRAALQKEYDDILVVKEELSKIVLKQNGILLDNSQELRKYAMLKVDHQVEIRRHERATKCLHEAESSIRGLDSQLERARKFADLAESTAKDAECARGAAVKEREAAINEVHVIREAMERRKEQAEIVQQKLDDLVQADATRLATNKTVATEVGYGDLTEEAGTMTTYSCPELTIRQLRRLPGERGLPPESVGRVYPTLKQAKPCEHPLGLLPYLACDRLPANGGEVWRKGWKQERGAPPSSSLSSFSGKGERPVHGIGVKASAVNLSRSEANLGVISDRPYSPQTLDHLYQSWTNGAQQHQEADEETPPRRARVFSHSSDDPNDF